MGWNSAGEIFDPIAQALVEAGVPDDTKTEVLGRLINALQDGDWDTEDESLDVFADDPAIVQAFRQNGVIRRCMAEETIDEVYRDCELETGHHDHYHQDYLGAWRSA